MDKNMDSKKYNKVAVGGTFDKFHDGHKKLLSAAFEIGNEIEIGVTSDAFGGLKGDIDSCKQRMANLKTYFSDKSNFIVVPLKKCHKRSCITTIAFSFKKGKASIKLNISPGET